MTYLRLKKQADFQKLFQSGKRAYSPSLTVLYKPSKKMVMGISVGKRHGKSVVRNRVKRLLREAFRSVEGEFQKTYSIVLLPKPQAEKKDYSFHTYQTHLRAILKKEKL
ncbi:MAG: ribonuclease P protein component [Clostridia bacterium]|nr:ribonuclease P protein component [Clostridia bacterium]